MKDRSTLAAHRAPALLAAVLVLAGGGRLATADQPTVSPDTTAPLEPPAMAAPALSAVPTPAPSATDAAPAAAPPPASAELTGAAWFARPRLAMTVGQGSRAFKLRFSGFLAADFMSDTTRSYDDSMGTLLVARSDTYENQQGRTQFSLKSTRLGFDFESPSVGELTPSARHRERLCRQPSYPAGNHPGRHRPRPPAPLQRVRLLRQPDLPHPSRVHEGQEPLRGPLDGAHLRRVRVAELFRSLGHPQSVVLAQSATATLPHIQHGRGRHLRARRRGGAPRAARLGRAGRQRRRARQLQRLAGHSHAGQRAHRGHASYPRDLGHRAAVQDECLHAPAFPELQQRDGLGHLARCLPAHHSSLELRRPR